MHACMCMIHAQQLHTAYAPHAQVSCIPIFLLICIRTCKSVCANIHVWTQNVCNVYTCIQKLHVDSNIMSLYKYVVHAWYIYYGIDIKHQAFWFRCRSATCCLSRTWHVLLYKHYDGSLRDIEQRNGKAEQVLHCKWYFKKHIMAFSDKVACFWMEEPHLKKWILSELLVRQALNGWPSWFFYLPKQVPIIQGPG